MYISRICFPDGEVVNAKNISLGKLYYIINAVSNLKMKNDMRNASVNKVRHLALKFGLN